MEMGETRLQNVKVKNTVNNAHDSNDQHSAAAISMEQPERLLRDQIRNDIQKNVSRKSNDSLQFLLKRL
jgi:hypothetical protein